MGVLFTKCKVCVFPKGQFPGLQQHKVNGKNQNAPPSSPETEPWLLSKRKGRNLLFVITIFPALLYPLHLNSFVSNLISE